MGIIKFLRKMVIEDEEFEEYDLDDESDEELQEKVDEPILIEKVFKEKEEKRREEKLQDELRRKNYEIEINMRQEITNVIMNYTSLEDLAKNAEIAASKINEEDVSKLIPFFERNSDYYGIEWENKHDFKMVLENSILMILYYCKARGVKELVYVMKNKKSIQLKTIKLLIDLAAEGIEIDYIIEEIGKVLDLLDREDKIKAFSYLSVLKKNTTVIGILQFYYTEFLEEKNVLYAYLTLVQLINVAESCTRSHLEFLKKVANGMVPLEGKIVRDIDMDLKIKAALTYYLLDNSDDSIYTLIKRYEFECDDKELLRQIEEIVEDRK